MNQLSWYLIAGGVLGKIQTPMPIYGNTTIDAIFNAPNDVLWLNVGVDGTVFYRDQEWHWLKDLKQQQFSWFRNRLWMSGDTSNIYVVDGDKFLKVQVPFEHSRCLRTDGQGNLWVASATGLWVSTNGDQWQRALPSQYNLSVQCFWIDSTDVVWLKFHNDNAFYKWENQQLTPISLPKKLDNLVHLRSVVRDVNGAIWICSDEQGLWSYINGNWHQAREAPDLTQPGLQGRIGLDLCLDRRNRIWAIVVPSPHCLVNNEWHSVLIRTSLTGVLPVNILRTATSFKCWLFVSCRERP